MVCFSAISTGAKVYSCLRCRYATGGEIPGVLPRLSDAELAVTQSQNNTGNVRAIIHTRLSSFTQSFVPRCSRSSPTLTSIPLDVAVNTQSKLASAGRMGSSSGSRVSMGAFSPRQLVLHYSQRTRVMVGAGDKPWEMRVGDKVIVKNK